MFGSKARIRIETYVLQLADWHSGNSLIVLECVSPYTERKLFEEVFVKNLKEVG